jgi:cysteine desulfuration protein SufE
MSILEIEQEIIEDFSMFESWMEKYGFIIDLGKELPIIDEKNKIKQNLISGCQSQVWIHAEYLNNKVVFTADSDAIITKGIIALLIRTLNNQSPKDIIEAKLDFINKIGIKSHLSPTRANGLLGMIKQLKSYALVFLLKENEPI